MKQRVGFARALVVEPEVLFLDEPFSALDVLVAENLRHELLDLWQARRIPTRAILMVTHNIDEAVQMADRLLVFGANPGRIRVELPGLTRELAGDGQQHAGRQQQMRQQPQVQRKNPARAQQQAQLVDTVYRVMTNPDEDVSALLPAIPGARPQQPPAPPQPYQALPHVGIDALTGFIERLHALEDREDLYALARDLHMEADDLLPLAQAANLLGFADLEAGDVVLTPVGRRFAEADILDEKAIFRQQAVVSIALLRQIMRDLEAVPEHRLEESGLLEALQQSFSEPEARRQLDTAIDWGRYAELFAYDDEAGEFYLEEETPAATGTTQLS
jgi:NitT/TauT family transport system ATP-binding protein